VDHQTLPTVRHVDLVEHAAIGDVEDEGPTAVGGQSAEDVGVNRPVESRRKASALPEESAAGRVKKSYGSLAWHDHKAWKRDHAAAIASWRFIRLADPHAERYPAVTGHAATDSPGRPTVTRGITRGRLIGPSPKATAPAAASLEIIGRKLLACAHEERPAYDRHFDRAGAIDPWHQFLAHSFERYRVPHRVSKAVGDGQPSLASIKCGLHGTCSEQASAGQGERYWMCASVIGVTLRSSVDSP
jgi:hypothetical protein